VRGERVRLCNPVEMQPRGEGRGMRGRGEVEGGELACCGPEQRARGARSKTALRGARHLGERLRGGIG
jgi:hypothetical protein